MPRTTPQRFPQTSPLHIFLFDLIINDMQGIYNNFSQSKKLFLGSTDGPGPATSSSTSTLITSTTDIMPGPSIPATSDATANAQVAAGVSVSVPSPIKY